MPRSRRASAATTPNAIIASAADITSSKMNRPKGNGPADWQAETWYFFDAIGEFRFASTWKAQACSRARLIITEETEDGDEEVTTGPEVDALDILFGGDSGQSQMLYQTALHLEVPGETYVVGEPDREDDTDAADWLIYSNDELARKGTGESARWEADRGDGKRLLSDDTVVIRLWRPHPRKWVEADSPARAALPVLREIEQLTKHIAATTDSRLAGAGLLLIPTELQVAPRPGAPEDEDPFMAMLTEAMMTAIGDRSSAAAVAPLIARVPGELVDRVKHISFATPFDQHVRDLMEGAIRRLALALDEPPEVMLGLGDTNHWSAWQIDESGLKTHVEPVLETITSGLTERWLQPAVEAMRATVNPMRRINYDTSDLRLRPDRSPQAIQLHQLDKLSTAALLRETGFEAGDEPDDDEQRTMLLHKIALGGDATMASQALALLGVDLGSGAITPSTPSPALEPPVAPPAEDVEDSRDLPVAASAVLACSELLVHRALERANNRCNNRGKTRRPLRRDQLDHALIDAWDQAPRVAALLDLDAGEYVAALDQYTRAVLTEGATHSPRVLERCLTGVPHG